MYFFVKNCIHGLKFGLAWIIALTCEHSPTVQYILSVPTNGFQGSLISHGSNKFAWSESTN
eukprot:c30407_g1_i1 orf=143-325(-)